VRLTEEQRMIEARSPQTSDEAFTLGIHVWMEAQVHLNVRSAYNVIEDCPELPISIANQKTRCRSEL
jgi:hypothetical protein